MNTLNSLKISEYQFLFLLGLFTMLIHIPYLSSSLGTDESMYLVASKEVSEGSTLYSEVYLGKTPGSIYVYSSLISLFGFSVGILRFTILLVNSLCVISTYFLAKEIYSKKVGGLASFLLALHITHPVFGAFEAKMDSFMILFSILAIYSFIKGIEKSNYKLLVFCGLMCSFSFIFKQPGILVFPVIVFSILLRSLKGKETLLKNVFCLSLVGLGFLIPLVCLFIKLFLEGSLDNMLSMTIFSELSSSSPGKSSFFSYPFFYYRNGIEILEIFNMFPIIFYAGIVSILLEIKFIYKSYFQSHKISFENLRKSFANAIEHRTGQVVLILWISAYFVFYFKLTLRPTYLLYVLPPMCIVSPQLLISIFEKYNYSQTNSQNNVINDKANFHKQVYNSKSAILITLVLFIILPLVPHPYPTDFIGKESIYNDNSTLEEASAYIKKNSDPEDEILTFCYSPQIYILSERSPSTTTYYSVMGRQANSNISDDIIESIENNPPLYIVTVENHSHSQTLDGTGKWYLGLTEVIDYIHDKYHVQKIYVNEQYSKPDGDIYIWKLNS